MRLATLSLPLLLAGCGHAAPGGGESGDRPLLVAYDCADGLALLARFDESGASGHLEWANRRVPVEHDASEGELAFAAEGVRLIVQGKNARFELRGEEPLACRRGPRARRIERLAAEGALVWAVGNEPGWTLELYPDRFVLEADYGEARYEGPIVGEQDWGGPRRYDGRTGATGGAEDGTSAGADAEEVGIKVTPGLCHDGMSGAPFGAEVVVSRGGDEYRGCGLLLAGGD